MTMFLSPKHGAIDGGMMVKKIKRGYGEKFFEGYFGI